MKEVDVVFSCKLNSSIGPVGTIKRLIKNRNFFFNNGFNINFYTLDDIDNNRIVSENTKSKSIANINKTSHNILLYIYSFRKSFLRFLTSFVKQMIPKPQNSIIGGVLMLSNSYYVSKKLVRYYNSQNNSPDIIVFHSIFDCYQVIKRLKKKSKSLRTKFILFLHSDGIPFRMDLIYYPKLKGTLFHKKLLKIVDFVNENLDQFVFIANIGQINFLKEYPNIDPNKTSLVRNGIDDFDGFDNTYSSYRFDDTNHEFKFKLCCVGTICERKGQRIIVEALSIIEKDVLKNIHVTFIGDGPEKSNLETFVNENALSDNVSFLGNMDNYLIPKHLSQSDIYILTSINEGLPISILEALRAGLPIISTRISGIPELVDDGVNGVLINPVINELVNVLNNIETYNWKLMGRNSRNQFLSSFTFERMKSDYLNMLNKTLTK